MKVLFLTNNGRQAAPSRTRVFDYLPFFKAAGIEVDVRVVIPDRLFSWAASGGQARRFAYCFRVLWRSLWIGLWTAWTAPRYDVIFIQRVLFPFPIPWILRRYRQKIIFDFDDAIFTTHVAHTGRMGRLRAWFRGRGLPPVLRMACHAIVENTYTATYAAQHCPAVSIITGPIDTDRYRPGQKTGRKGVVLGWIGSRTTTRYLELIRAPLTELAHRHPRLSICLIGAEGFEPDGLPVTLRRWSLETEVADLQTFDIGLMPLPDDVWTRGKGGYKLLQYLSMGVPVVASPVGINREIVKDGVNGFLAASDREWMTGLERLIRDPDLRRRMGADGRGKMEACYSLKQSSQRLLQILASVATGRAA